MIIFKMINIKTTVYIYKTKIRKWQCPKVATWAICLFFMSRTNSIIGTNINNDSLVS